MPLFQVEVPRSSLGVYYWENRVSQGVCPTLLQGPLQPDNVQYH